jgi:hypothetical protein
VRPHRCRRSGETQQGKRKGKDTGAVRRIRIRRAMSKACAKCAKEMADGGLAYEVRIQVYADFDGVLPQVETAEELEARLAELVAAMDERDPDELMRDVYHEERHLLCPACRERYLANPLNLPLQEGLL